MDILKLVVDHGYEIVAAYVVLVFLGGLAVSDGPPPKRMARIGK